MACLLKSCLCANLCLQDAHSNLGSTLHSFLMCLVKFPFIVYDLPQVVQPYLTPTSNLLLRLMWFFNF